MPNKTGLITRLGNSWDAFKAQMRFSSSMYGGSGMREAQGFSSWADLWNQRNQGTQIRYETEVGDLSKSSLVMTASNWIGRRLPEAPIRVYEPDGEGGKKEVEEHELAALLRRPNPYFAGSRMWKTWGFNWLLNGNVYWRKIRDNRGRIIQLWPIPYWMISPRWNNNNATEFIGWYEYRINNSKEIIPVEDIIHWRDGQDPDNDRLGCSPLRSLLREVYADNEVSNFAAVLMRNGGIPDFILAPADNAASLSEKDAKLLAEDFDRRRTGDNRNKAIVASKGIKIERLTMDPKQLDLSGLRNMPEARFAAAIGVPASVLGLKVAMDRSIQSNVEGWGEDATEEYLVPLWNYIAEELTVQLLPDYDANENLHVGHDLRQVAALQQDQDKLFSRWGGALRDTGITINQFLTAIGQNPQPGLDIYIIPSRSLPMTAEALIKIANDPTVLQQGMPAEQQLAEQQQPPVKTLPFGAPDEQQLRLIRRALEGYPKMRQLYGAGSNGHSHT